MSNDKHTAEPWKHMETRVYLGNEGGFDLCDAPSPEANARRIVACVNACAGIETEKLEAVAFLSPHLPAGLKNKAIDYADLLQQRAKLLAAAKNVVHAFDQSGEIISAIDSLEAEIAEIEAAQ